MGAYYPSLVVNFKLKFDESLTLIPMAAPASPDDMAKARDAQSAPASEAVILQAGIDHTSFVLNRVPKKCSVEMPGYRQAAKFSLSLDFKQLPIDPRTVRGAAVEIYLGTVSADDFAAGVTQTTPGPTGARTTILQTRDAAGQPLNENLLMVGMVDEWEVTHAVSGSEVSMSGRDLRGALLDTPIANSPSQIEAFFKQIELSEDIKGVVECILKLQPLFKQTVVRVNEQEWPGGVLPSPSGSAASPRHRKGAKGNRKAPPAHSGKAAPSEMSVWDLIVKECYLCGAIPYFVGTELHIRPARTIFDQNSAGIDPVKNPTPFAGGRPRAFEGSGGTQTISYRRIVYGRDAKELSFHRKFGGYQRPKAVRVVTTDQSSEERGADRTIVAQWPTEDELTKGAATTKVSPGGDASQTEYLNIPVAGIRDKTQLQKIAQGVYEEIGRGEMGGHCTTGNKLSSFAGSNADADILRIKPGDAVEFAVDTRNLTQIAPLVATYTDSMRDSFAVAVKDLTARLGDQNLARVIVATARGAIAELQPYFRVSNVKYDWATSSGVDVAFDFQNYVVPRNQIGKADIATGASTATSVPGKSLNTTKANSPNANVTTIQAFLPSAQSTFAISDYLKGNR